MILQDSPIQQTEADSLASVSYITLSGDITHCRGLC